MKMNEILEILYNWGLPLFSLFVSIRLLVGFFQIMVREYFCVEKSKKVKPNSVLKSFDKRKVSLKKSDESLPTNK